MQVNFKIAGGDDGTTCGMLFGDHGQEKDNLLTINGNEIKTSRVVASLLQKCIGRTAMKLRYDRGPRKGKSGKRVWKRLLHVATAMSGKCVADSGEMTRFHDLVMTSEFEDAFLTNEYNTRCLSLGGESDHGLPLVFSRSECLKWTLTERGSLLTQVGGKAFAVDISTGYLADAGTLSMEKRATFLYTNLLDTSPKKTFTTHEQATVDNPFEKQLLLERLVTETSGKPMRTVCAAATTLRVLSVSNSSVATRKSSRAPLFVSATTRSAERLRLRLRLAEKTTRNRTKRRCSRVRTITTLRESYHLRRTTRKDRVNR